MSQPTPSLEPSQEEELFFWRIELDLRGEYTEVVLKRLNPTMRYTEYPAEMFLRIERYLGAKRPFRVLELGSGPISTLAHGVDTGQIEVVAVDVLADQYRKLLGELRLQFPVVPIQGSGEHLDTLVSSASFDCAYVRNALDHTEDPGKCFDNLIRAVRPGGLIYLTHATREGSTNKWSPSHKWDFDFCDHGVVASSRNQVRYLDRNKPVSIKHIYYSSVEFGRVIEVLYERKHAP